MVVAIKISYILREVRTEAEETTEDLNFSPYDTGSAYTIFFPSGDMKIEHAYLLMREIQETTYLAVRESSTGRRTEPYWSQKY